MYSYARRQKLIQEMNRINREMAETQKSIIKIESKIATFQKPQAKAA
jgi:hypothetical protein